MKTQIKAMLLLLSVILMGSICSCAKHSSDNDDDTDDIEKVNIDEATVQKLVDKYKDEGWTKLDYTKAIDIMEEYANMVFNHAESILKKASSEDEFWKEYESYIEKYKYIDENLWEILDASYESEMGEKNYERWQKLCNKTDRRKGILSHKVEAKFDVAVQEDSDYAEAPYSAEAEVYEEAPYEEVAVEAEDYIAG